MNHDSVCTCASVDLCFNLDSHSNVGQTVGRPGGCLRPGWRPKTAAIRAARTSRWPGLATVPVARLPKPACTRSTKLTSDDKSVEYDEYAAIAQTQSLFASRLVDW